MFYLQKYLNVLRNVEEEAVASERYGIPMSLGEIVASVIVKGYIGDVFERISEAVASILKVFVECTFGKETGNEDCFNPPS